MVFAHLRAAAALALVGLLILVAGCTEASGSAPAETIGPKPPPTQTQSQPANVPLAKVQSITPAKPIGPDPAGGPRLAIDTERVEFGNVPYQTVAAYSFNVKNVGSAPVFLGLPFIRVKEGC